MWGQRGEGRFNSLQQLYQALEHKGLGDKFLTNILTHWDEGENPLSVVLDAIGGAYNPDKDLLYKYIIPEALDLISNLTIKMENIYSALEPGEEASFYDTSSRNDVDCHAVAEEIWSEEGLSWEPYDSNPELDYLLENEMTEENIEALKHLLDE